MKEKKNQYKKEPLYGSVYCVLDGSTEGFQIWKEPLHISEINTRN